MSFFNLSIKLIFNKKVESILIITFFLLILIASLSSFAFLYYYQQRIYPGIFIDDQAMSGLTEEEALKKLNALDIKSKITLEILAENTLSISKPEMLQPQANYKEMVEDAYQIGRSDQWWNNLKIILSLFIHHQSFNSQLSYQENDLRTILEQLAEKVRIVGSEAEARLKYSGNINSIEIFPGSYGRELDSAQTIFRINQLISQDIIQTDFRNRVEKTLQIQAVIASTSAVLSVEEIDQAVKRSQLFVGKQLSARTDGVKLMLNDQEIINLLSFPQGISEKKISNIIIDWEQKVNRPPTDAVFEYDPQTLKVKTFIPHKNGLALNKEQSKKDVDLIIQKIEQSSSLENPGQDFFELSLQVETEKPKITLAETNDLGINEMIGFGDSHYEHSIPSRIHNVKITTDKLRGHIIKPGEEFSFNQTVGEVSRRTGYQPAYVISGGRTVLGDGGGVCQVSTTTFRAALNAGLPITKRKAHSYRVSYYELDNKPGFDATVYAGDVDLRFINDTGHYILIWGEADSDHVYMKIEIYGTSDGRQTEIVDYKMWDYRPPPAPVYIPDPSLPPGKIRQIDWSASGIKSYFKNVVKDKDGNIIRTEEYYSNFQPWSAKYLKGV